MNDVVKSNGLPVIPNYQAFDEIIEKLPLILSYLTVGQKDEVAGKIVDNSGVEVDLSSSCIVKVTSGRAMWTKPYNPDIKDPLCRSYDGKKPDVNLFLSGKAEGRPPAQICKDCKYSQTADESGNWQRPRCDSHIILWGINAAEGMPFVLTLSGMSLGSKSQNKGKMTVKQIISELRMRNQPPYLFDVGISVGKAKGEKGSAYVAMFQKNGQFTEERLTDLAGIIRDIGSRTSEDLEKASEESE